MTIWRPAAWACHLNPTAAAVPASPQYPQKWDQRLTTWTAWSPRWTAKLRRAAARWRARAPAEVDTAALVAMAEVAGRWNGTSGGGIQTADTRRQNCRMLGMSCPRYRRRRLGKKSRNKIFHFKVFHFYLANINPPPVSLRKINLLQF